MWYGGLGETDLPDGSERWGSSFTNGPQEASLKGGWTHNSWSVLGSSRL